MIAHKHYVNFLLKTGFTQAQLLLLILIYHKDKEYIEKYKHRFPTDDGSMIGKAPTQDLYDKGYIDKDNNGDIIVTSKFKKELFTDEPEEAIKELIAIYPPFFNKGGVKIPLVTVNSYEYSLRYMRRINYSIEEHNEVLKDLQYGLDNNLITFGISKFIDSYYWEAIRRMRLGEKQTDNIINKLTNEDF